MYYLNCSSIFSVLAPGTPPVLLLREELLKYLCNCQKRGSFIRSKIVWWERERLKRSHWFSSSPSEFVCQRKWAGHMWTWERQRTSKASVRPHSDPSDWPAVSPCSQWPLHLIRLLSQAPLVFWCPHISWLAVTFHTPPPLNITPLKVLTFHLRASECQCLPDGRQVPKATTWPLLPLMHSPHPFVPADPLSAAQRCLLHSGRSASLSRRPQKKATESTENNCCVFESYIVANWNQHAVCQQIQKFILAKGLV